MLQAPRGTIKPLAVNKNNNNNLSALSLEDLVLFLEHRNLLDPLGPLYVVHLLLLGLQTDLSNIFCLQFVFCCCWSSDPLTLFLCSMWSWTCRRRTYIKFLFTTCFFLLLTSPNPFSTLSVVQQLPSQAFRRTYANFLFTTCFLLLLV